MKRIFFIISCLFLLSQLLRCTENVAGGGLDTESSGGKLTGMVIDVRGVAADDAELLLIPEKYTPFDTSGIHQTHANRSGFFSIDSLDTGTYNLQAYDRRSGTKLLHRNIKIRSIDDTVVLSNLTLQTPGNIYIKVESATDGKFTAFIKGTQISLNISSFSDTLKFESLPPGSLPPILYADPAGTTTRKLTDTINLLPSQTISLSKYLEWEHTKKLTLDISGGEINSSMSGSFPLLLQLDTTLLDFTKAAADGNDLRFTDMIGSPLPFEIEDWNSGNKSATLWIRLDSLPMIVSPSYILMYYGNSSAKKPANAPVVFDTSKGFRGVYHINIEDVGVKNHEAYADVSGMKNHGDDFIADREQVQWIGNGKHFDYGEEDYIVADPLAGCNVGSGAFTISFWMNSDYKQKSTLFRWYFSEADTHSVGTMLENDSTIGVYYDSLLLFKSTAVSSKAWHHILLTRSTEKILALYIDGLISKSEVFATEIKGSRYSALFIAGDRSVLSISEDLPVRTFNGYMDEFRIEATSRSEEYVQNTYITQFKRNLLLIVKY